eukprot:PhF_6_TR13368/c0_g1_i2/m.21197
MEVHEEFFVSILASRDVEVVQYYLKTRPEVNPFIFIAPSHLNGMDPLEYCVVMADLEVLKVLLETPSHPPPTEMVGKALLNAVRLNYADFVCVLLDALGHRDSFQSLPNVVITKDDFIKVGPSRIYISGNQNVVHVSVEAKSKSIVEALYEMIFPKNPEVWNKLLMAKDNDGCTPQDIAQFQSFACERLTTGTTGTPPPPPFDTKSSWMQHRINRIASLKLSIIPPQVCPLQQQELQLHQQQERRQQSFKPSPMFLEFTPTYNGEVLIDPTVLSSIGTIFPHHVYQVSHLFTPAFVEIWKQEVVKIRTEIPKHMLSLPNSMNNYGFVLQTVGYKTWLEGFANQVLFPLAVQQKIIDVTSTSQRQQIKSFRSVHAFIIRYKQGEDLDLAEHMDDSDFTFNLCLGFEGFQGAQLYFKNRVRRADSVWVEKIVRYDHTPGVAVCHEGAIQHGVDPLRSGERMNLVVWCKTKEFGYST